MDTKVARLKMHVAGVLIIRSIRIAGLSMLLTTLALLAVGCSRSDSVPAGFQSSAPSWYVSASAVAGGDGSIQAPFNTLAAVEKASAAGDNIIVLPSPINAAALDGGIALKAGQRLIGYGLPIVSATPPTAAAKITNTTSSRNSGDAVVLANGVEVANLMIVSPYRGGIYGLNVPGVHIHDNDVSGHNTSCVQGIIIPPDTLPTNIPGVTFPNPAPLPNGWAGIYLLADQGAGDVSIRNNIIHDSPCGDGIDVGLSGGAIYTALIDGNTAYKLTQSGNFSAGILSVLAVGMQTKNISKLTATVSNNIQHDIGTSGSNSADPECVYPNVVDASTIVANITNNYCYNSVGGWSANGLEIPMMNDGGTAIINVSDSIFTNVTSDIIEPIALGTNQYLEVNLNNVTASHANGQGASPLIDIAGQFSYGNEGDCLSMFSSSGGNTLKLTMNNSTLSDCYFNGLSIGTNNQPGSTPTTLISFEINNSRITANRGNGIRFFNGSGLKKLIGKVQNSDISGNGTAPNALSPRYNIKIDNQGGATPEVSLDFGGGPLGSVGGNCIYGGSSDVEVSGYAVLAKNNWWGTASGPATGRTTISGGGSLDIAPVLSAAPVACSN
jgi:hypothetical protein